jgi:hypothetical protein
MGALHGALFSKKVLLVVTCYFPQKGNESGHYRDRRQERTLPFSNMKTVRRLDSCQRRIHASQLQGHDSYLVSQAAFKALARIKKEFGQWRTRQEDGIKIDGKV